MSDLASGLLKQAHQALLGCEDGVGHSQAAHVVIHSVQLPLLRHRRDGTKQRRGVHYTEEGWNPTEERGSLHRRWMEPNRGEVFITERGIEPNRG